MAFYTLLLDHLYLDKPRYLLLLAFFSDKAIWQYFSLADISEECRKKDLERIFMKWANSSDSLMLLIVLEIRCLFPVSCSHSLISFHGYSIQWKELQLHRHLSPIIWILYTDCLIEGTAPWRRSGWPAMHLSMLSSSTATGQMQRLDWHYSRTNRNKTSKMKLRFFPQDAASGADGETIAGRRIRVSPARPRTVGPRDRFIPDKYSRDRGKSPSWNRILGLGS